MKKVNLLDANGNSYVVEVPDDFYPETMVVEEPEPVDERQEKDFEKVCVLSNSGAYRDEKVEEMSIEMYDRLHQLSCEMMKDLTGMCIYKYKTHDRYERLSVKAWSKLMEVQAYCVENGLVTPDNRGDISLDEVVFAFAMDCAEKGDSSHLDWGSDDFYFEPEHALASNDFQTAMGKLCKLLRMCFYSNSLTFHNRLEVEYAVGGSRDWVSPELVEEYSELCWDC